MRTLTAAMANELGLTVTAPGFFIEIQFDGYTVRYSSFGDVTWNGSPWIGALLDVKGLAWDENGFISGGSFKVGNLDGAFGALALQYDIVDRPVKIWAVYAGALAAGDPVLVLDGAGDEATIDLKWVAVGLAIAGSNALYSPREVYCPGTGFNFLPPVGEEINFNGEIFRLDRADY